MPKSRIAVLDTIKDNPGRWRRYVAFIVKGMNREREPIGDSCGHHCGHANGIIGHCACTECHGQL